MRDPRSAWSPQISQLFGGLKPWEMTRLRPYELEGAQELLKAREAEPSVPVMTPEEEAEYLASLPVVGEE